LKKNIQGKSYITDEVDNWVSLYVESDESQDWNAMRNRTSAISKGLNTSVFAFIVHDSSDFGYALFSNGVLKDEYESNPDFLEEQDDSIHERLKGNIEVIFPYCKRGITKDRLEKLLHERKSESDNRTRGIESYRKAIEFMESESKDREIRDFEYFKKNYYVLQMWRWLQQIPLPVGEEIKEKLKVACIKVYGDERTFESYPPLSFDAMSYMRKIAEWQKADAGSNPEAKLDKFLTDEEIMQIARQSAERERKAVKESNERVEQEYARNPDSFKGALFAESLAKDFTSFLGIRPPRGYMSFRDVKKRMYDDDWSKYALLKENKSP